MSHHNEPGQIDRDYVRLLMVMRRFIRDEFDIKISISEADGPSQLLDYAKRSRNNVLQEMGKELHTMLSPEPSSEENELTEKVHYYRGAAITVAASNVASNTEETEKKVSKQRIYRGQVVNA